MKAKLLPCLVLVFGGLGINVCFASGNAQNRFLGPANSQFIISTNAGGGTATITRYTGSSGKVIVPDRINSLTVTSIGARAFWANSMVTSVILPDSITNIGSEAFSAVDSHSSLTNVVIGKGVITIGSGAFVFCDKLTNVKIPKNVSHIGNSAFGGCFGLESISVDSNNLAYCSVDGVLFNKNQTELVQYPPGKSGNFTIPGTVTNIADYALWNCPKLTSVVIPEGIKTIKKEAFAACRSLTNITIPTSVTNIDLWAFDSCGSLKGVYFRGNAPGHREYHGYKGIDIYHIFNGNDQATVYYLPGTTGWGKTFDGHPTALWGSRIQRNRTPVSEICDAVKTGDLAEVEALLKRNPKLVSSKDPNPGGYKLDDRLARDWTPLHVAAAYGHDRVAALLLAKGAKVNARDRTGWTPLHWAASEGHADVAELLLTNGAYINATNYFGVTPLNYAASMGQKDVAKLLLANKADTSIGDNLGRTPLQMAALDGRKDIVKLLLAKGANVNAKDNFGGTPLSEAASRGYTDIVKLLLTHNAEVNSVDKLGRTPLSYAMGHKDVAELLRQHGGHE